MEAAARGRAKLVIGDNLYIYDQAPGPIREDRPMSATTHKGRARARVVEGMLQAHREGQGRVTFGRSSDFFGPYALEQSNLGGRVFPPLLRGQPVLVMGNVDIPHTLTYIEDFGKALMILREHDKAFGRAWHVPNAPTVTRWEILERASRLAGQPLRIRAQCPWPLRPAGLFVPGLRKLAEMQYAV